MSNESLRNLQLGASQRWRVWLIPSYPGLELCVSINFTPSTFSEHEAHNSMILCLQQNGSNTALCTFWGLHQCPFLTSLNKALHSLLCVSPLYYPCSLFLAPQLITRPCSKLTEIDSVSRNRSSRLSNTGFHPPLSWRVAHSIELLHHSI